MNEQLWKLSGFLYGLVAGIGITLLVRWLWRFWNCSEFDELNRKLDRLIELNKEKK